MISHYPDSQTAIRSFFLRLCSEVPILEDTLMRILVIGLSRELPLGPADAMELADHLVKRAAAVQADGNSMALCLPSLSQRGGWAHTEDPESFPFPHALSLMFPQGGSQWGCIGPLLWGR